MLNIGCSKIKTLKVIFDPLAAIKGLKKSCYGQWKGLKALEYSHLGFWKSWKIPGLDFWESLDQDFEKILGSHRITIERPLTIQTALHCLNSSMSAFLYCWGRLEHYCKGRADQHLSKMWDGVGDGWILHRLLTLLEHLTVNMREKKDDILGFALVGKHK